MSDLDGATELGFPNALAGTPGQFAARWNAHTEEERAVWLRDQQDAAQTALACRYLENHRGQLDLLQAREGMPLAERLAERTMWTPEEWQRLMEAANGGLPAPDPIAKCPATHPKIGGGGRCALDDGHLGIRHVTAHGQWWEDA